jgi:hypothetical protein
MMAATLIVTCSLDTVSVLERSEHPEAAAILGAID